MKLRGQRVHQKYGDEKVERIQRPAQKGGAARMPLLRIKEGFRRTG
jgi:hypothetical protein